MGGSTAGSGQREPPRLVLEVGGTSTLQAANPLKLKSPPLQSSKKGGLQLSRHGCLQSWSPPPALQAQVWGVHAGLTQLYIVSLKPSGLNIFTNTYIYSESCTFKVHIFCLNHKAAEYCKIQGTHTHPSNFIHENGHSILSTVSSSKGSSQRSFIPQ